MTLLETVRPLVEAERLRVGEGLVVRPRDETQLGTLLSALPAGTDCPGLVGLRGGDTEPGAEAASRLLVDCADFDGLALLACGHLLRVGSGVHASNVERYLQRQGRSLCWPATPPIPLGVWLALRALGPAGPRGLPGHSPVAGFRALSWSGNLMATCVAPRSATGPDLSGLFLGAHARVGLLTELVLRVHPAPALSETVRVEAQSFEQGLRLIVGLLEADLVPDRMALEDLGQTVALRWRMSGDAETLLAKGQVLKSLVGGAVQRVPEAQGRSESGPSYVRSLGAGGRILVARFSEILEARRQLRATWPAVRMHLESLGHEGGRAYVLGMDPDTQPQGVLRTLRLPWSEARLLAQQQAADCLEGVQEDLAARRAHLPELGSAPTTAGHSEGASR